MRLRWLGHAMFLIESPGGIRVAIDPYPGSMGYGPHGIGAHVVAVSHEHFDHNAVAEVEGDPLVLRGLDPNGKWTRLTREVGDVRLAAIAGTYHDDKHGAGRGRNTLWSVETGGVRLLHLGDLGHVPTPAVTAAAGRVDVLLVPVGGVYTLDAAGAGQAVERLAPRVVIPMHYRTAAVKDWPIAPVDEFLAGQTGTHRLDAPEVSLDPEALPSEREIWVPS